MQINPEPYHVPKSTLAWLPGGRGLVFVQPTPRAITHSDLQAHLRLTPTQARVATMLFGRRMNNEIAVELGTTVYTARRHVEGVLLRLGTGSRYDVERIIREIANELK